MSSRQKLGIVFDLMRTTRRQTESRIREQDPTASDREVFLRLVGTWLDHDTMVRAYGTDPLANDSR